MSFPVAGRDNREIMAARCGAAPPTRGPGTILLSRKRATTLAPLSGTLIFILLLIQKLGRGCFPVKGKNKNWFPTREKLSEKRGKEFLEV